MTMKFTLEGLYGEEYRREEEEGGRKEDFRVGVARWASRLPRREYR